MKTQRHALVGQPGLWEVKRNFQARFLRSTGLRPHHYLLDVGCGTLRGGIPLIDYLDRGHYCGVEVRDYVLAEGRRELADENLEHKQPVLVHFERFADLDLPRNFDRVWAFSVLIHMSDGIVEQLFPVVAKYLKGNGTFYANISTNELGDGTWHEFPLVHRGVKFYRELARKNGMTTEDLGTLASLGHVTGKRGHDEGMRMLAFRKVV